MSSSLKVILAHDVVQICIITVSLFHNLLLQRLRIVIERIAHLLNHSSLVEPSLHLFRICLHLFQEVAIYRLVFFRRVRGGTVKALLNNREAIEHFGRNVQCQHSHQDDIHKVNHLLARRYWFFLYCHLIINAIRFLFVTLTIGICLLRHIGCHSLYHARVDLVELFYLLSHLL